MNVDVAIVGAGPAGLNAAAILKDHLSVVVLEATDRIGGRLLSIKKDSAHIDLGATWFWGNEKLINEIVYEHDLKSFNQYQEGNSLFQTSQFVEELPTNQMEQTSIRLLDGMQSIARILYNQLDSGTVYLNEPVISVNTHGDILEVNTSKSVWNAKHVIVAVAPAAAVHTIDFHGIEPNIVELAEKTPVWMGKVSKVICIYKTPFWRDANLSGTAFSYLGPMREIHDMSIPESGLSALFGFVQNSPNGKALNKKEILVQLIGLFGAHAGNPLEIIIQDWADEKYISPPQEFDQSGYQLYGHPFYSQPAMNGKLYWASTETASDFPGHIEGALVASKRAAERILRIKESVI